jgi:carboxypeptidase Q
LKGHCKRFGFPCSRFTIHFSLFTLLLFTSPQLYTQSSPPSAYTEAAAKIADTGLTELRAFTMLSELTGTIGSRLSGSPQAAQAVEWGKRTMLQCGFDSVYLQPVMVPHWVRGSVERASIIDGEKKISLTICALGGSIATPKEGITAEVIEVHSLDEAKNLGEKAKGKIVFFNRPMDPTKVQTMNAYGGAVDQRGGGAIEAAKVGAVAALVRSMSLAIDDVPHTGVMHYVDSVRNIPSAAVSTAGANMLSEMLKKGKTVRVKIELSCETLPDVESANVIGEIRGSEKPGEVIVIGGHLDSWDKGQGAHDDGAGAVQSMEALRLLKELGLKPKRTIRCVLFMNEENGLRGGKAYAAAKRPAGEKDIAAIETDAGGFAPLGFGVTTDSAAFEKFKKFSGPLEAIGADRIQKGGGGADISPLAEAGVPMIGLMPENQRYFDYHHSDKDTIDKVNPRELELGAIALAIFAYEIAQEGL